MNVGVDYYPEHWDPAMWPADAVEMKAAGITLVRLAEFAWSRLEPQEDQFDFRWLDNAIALFAAQRINIIIGTPTAAPPNWLVEKYQDILPVDHHKHPVYPGVRCHRCYNSPSLRRHALNIIEALTRHYVGHSAVIGWQTDNEIAANDCHCENCTREFRSWLQRKYLTLENLNQAWGTVVWSGEYSAWSQVTTPLGGSPHHNPSFVLDFQRFSSDSAADFNRFQAEIIRKNCPRHFVTHNLWGYPVVTDYYRLFDPMDFVSVDYYPSTDLKDDTKAAIYHGALTLDLTRGVKRKNFWVMEQLSGTPGCWNPMSRAPWPGMIRAHGWQSISRGADSIIHFRWRTARAGAEQFWHGLLDSHGHPGRRLAEFKTFASEVAQLNDLISGTRLHNEVALLFSHEQNNAFNIQPQSDGFDYFKNLKQLHQTLVRQGVGVDVINWTENVDDYTLVVAPFLFLEDAAVALTLENYVKGGGTLVLTTRTGVKNSFNVCQSDYLPGLLGGIGGIRVEEYDPVGFDKQKILLFKDEIGCSQWCDIIMPITAKTIGVYASDFFSGRSAVTVNAVGKGSVYYIGSVLDDSGYRRLFADILRECRIEFIDDLPAGVELSVRCDKTKRLLFILNLTKEQQSVSLPERVRYDAFSGEAVLPTLSLGPFEVRIVLEE
ncbi:beta-galactosidase [Sodalis sp. dw_96]|uniref:beta-galactosidase n=1 Tax=Sodalis sp. dw_96 TaxID=2719794 RepID=UPI001BD2ACB4|nr:beta-galactosidase [Sodalis sp. dw_96]